MAKLNVLLEARAKDRGVARFLRQNTALAGEFTAAMASATRAGRGLGSMQAPAATRGRGRGGGGRAARAGNAAEREMAKAQKEAAASAKRRVKDSRAFERAIEGALRDARREGKALDKQARLQERSARNIKNMTREQLEGLELEREINRRRRVAARNAAKQKLGPGPAAGGGGGRRGGGRGMAFAADLAIAGQEFEQVGQRIEQGARASFDAFSDYEKAVMEVSTLKPDISVEQIQEFTKAAAKEYGGLPKDQVAAFYAIVSAGATDAASAQEQLNAANKLAIGGVATQEEAVLAISKSVANFKSQGVDATRASDILFASVRRGQTTVSELARAVPSVANSAATAGLTMEDTAAAVSMLSTKLPSASEAATGLNQALSNISKPSKQARKEAKRLGIDFSAAGIEAAGGFEEWLVQLRSAEGFSEQTMGRLFESTQARRAIGGLLEDTEGFHSVLEDAKGSAGAAEEAYAKMSDTSAQKAAKLEAQWELLKIQAGEALVPALTDLTKAAAPIIEKVTDWIEKNPKLASGLAKGALAVAVLARALGGLSSGLSMLNTLTSLGTSKMDAFGGSVNKAGKGAVGTKGSLSSLGPVMGALGTVLVGAGVAIAAFEFALEHAQKPLAEYEAHIEKTTEEQRNISFTREATAEESQKIAQLEAQLAQAKTKDEKQLLKEKIAAAKKVSTTKSDEDILREQRDRLIADVNATRKLAYESKGGGGWEKLMAGDTVDAFGQAYGSILNRASGVQEEYERQQTQAELDLARFDKQYSEQLGIAEEEQFTTTGAGGSLSERLANLIEEQVAATKEVAANTKAQQWQGPTMEAGA